MQEHPRRTFWILASLLCMVCPFSAAAVGEYDGVWVGPEAVYVEGQLQETLNSGSIVSQANANELYLADDLLGPIRLVRSGGAWLLPAPISTTFLGLDVVVNSMRVIFSSLTQLSGTVGLTVDNNGTPVDASATFAFTKQTCPALPSGTPVQNLSGGEDSYRCFQIEVPPEALRLSAQTSGGAGDCDLEVVFSKPPFTADSSENEDNNESVSISSPETGLWYVVLYGYSSYSGLTLTASYQAVPLVQAAFSAAPTTGRVPLSVAFTDQSTGSVSGWSWNFGDGAVSAQRNPTHIYRTPGTYSVSLTVSGPANSDTETKNDLIRVEAAKVTSWIPLLLGN